LLQAPLSLIALQEVLRSVFFNTLYSRIAGQKVVI